MPDTRPPPPRAAGKAALHIIAIIAAIIVTIFVGLNLHHADAMRELQSGQVAPKDAPKSPTDLQSAPVPR